MNTWYVEISLMVIHSAWQFLGDTTKIIGQLISQKVLLLKTEFNNYKLKNYKTQVCFQKNKVLSHKLIENLLVLFLEVKLASLLLDQKPN